MIRHNNIFFISLLLAFGLTGCVGGDSVRPPEGIASDADPAEIALGERLFLETRFAQFFAANMIDVNTPLRRGDPALDHTLTVTGTLPGPFAGGTMNCAACHLVDQQLDQSGGGMRSYNDFARRPPIPDRSDRGDNRRLAVRNSQPLVGSVGQRSSGLLFHFDGEFIAMSDLVAATLSGRNYGWMADEKAAAITHIAHVVRNDDGSGELAQEFGGAYGRVLLGLDTDIPPELVLPMQFRIDVAKATDAEIFSAVSKLIAAYVNDLAFTKNEAGVFNGSPYDAFLAANQLPARPAQGESEAAYGKRLLSAVQRLSAPVFITDNDGEQNFDFHEQKFLFGATELDGLIVFLTQVADGDSPSAGVGNCVACHAPPHFTDFGIHNTGVTQHEYDGVHGGGKFFTLAVPDLLTRNKNYDDFLPATSDHPGASERFRAIADPADPDLTDLGAWNVFANPDLPESQDRLRHLLCQLRSEPDCNANNDEHRLNSAIATFKTPGLRDLGHSAPYMHNGAFSSIADVVQFYRDISLLARGGLVRNADPTLAGIAIDTQDVVALTAFLQSLNEDYE